MRERKVLCLACHEHCPEEADIIGKILLITDITNIKNQKPDI